MQEVAERTEAVDYHRDYSAVSRSMLSVLKESPRLYYELFVSRTRRQSPPTAAMIRGTRFEMLLMEPGTYYRNYAVSPEFGPGGEPWDRRKKEHKAAWEAWCQENVGKQPVTTEEHRELREMVAGALRHPEIDRVASAEGKLQHRLDWHDPVTGIACKAMLDKSFVSAELVVDVKTADDPSPEPFSRSVAKYGYHRQRAHYGHGYKINFGESPRFLFCVVGSKPPYDAAVYELDADAVAVGESETDILLAKLADLQSSGDWQPSWSGGVVTLGLPKWHNPFANEVIE